jgi:hypothetical protein
MSLKVSIHKKINAKGQREQEQGFLFSGLYPDKKKRVTKRYKGKDKEFANNLKRNKYGN